MQTAELLTRFPRVLIRVPLVAVGLLILIAAPDNSVSNHALTSPSVLEGATQAKPMESYGKVPLTFEANRGQASPQVKFLSRGSDYTLFLTREEAVLVLSHPSRMSQVEPRMSNVQNPKSKIQNSNSHASAVLRMKLLGANPAPKISGEDELSGKANYFIGSEPRKWRTNVPMYARVKYQDIYAGIDLVFYGNQRDLETDFIVRPGADPKAVKLGFEGLVEANDRSALEIDEGGDLVLHTAAREVRLRKPFIYQEASGVRQEIAGGYVLEAANHVGFQVSAYDPTKPLVIDPVLLAYSTLLGGSSFSDGADNIAVDAAGNAYVIGQTDSSDFPTTSGAFQTAPASRPFVTKLNPTGTGLVYSTFFSADYIVDIAVDGRGNAYFTGSASAGLPTTQGGYQTTHRGTCYYGYNNQYSYPCSRAFVTKLNPTGSGLVYSTYLGGGRDNSGENGTSIAVDAAGNAYVTGSTWSNDFPTSAGAFQRALNGAASKAFVTKLNAAGSGLVYSTYFGGETPSYSGSDGAGIAVDLSGNIYVAGNTGSTDFPITQGAYQTSNAGDTDVFVAKFDPTQEGPASLLYSTYLGGTSWDIAGYGSYGSVLAVDDAGNAYVAGGSFSRDFPTTPGAFSARGEAFVAKVDPTQYGAASLVYSALFGSGVEGDEGHAIAVDHAGTAFVIGGTTNYSFPTVNAFQPEFGGAPDCCDIGDAFVTRVNPAGTGLVYSSYFGKGDFDDGAGIAVDPAGNAYVVGLTGGGGYGNAGFPTTSGAFQTEHLGDNQATAFVAKIVDVGQASGSGATNIAGGFSTFNFGVQRVKTGALSGALDCVNHATGAVLHSVMVTGFVIDGKTAAFTGTCTRNKAPCTYTVNVTDNGSGSSDAFTISISGGTPEGGALRNGDIQIQHWKQASQGHVTP